MEEFLRRAMETQGDTVYRLALCRLQNTADAEDVYQDVFLRLLSQDTADWDSEHLRAWLIRATLNRCTDFWRFRLRRPTLSLAQLPELMAPEGSAAELWDAVARLPEAQRTVVHLHYAEGYSTQEIAALTHTPAATVRTRLHRARKKLKDLLGGSEDEEQSLSSADDPYPSPGRAE